MNKTLLALIASAVFAGTAIAAEAPKFETLDQDGDGKISAQEAAGYNGLAGAWEQVDANKDGVVDSAEFSAFETMEMKKDQ